ncbi:MAG: hypothetical protein LLF96_02340 [Eubacteriales bacterium]|nr:hypothetical protein [Eubacteriales bacterium]
MLYTIHALPEKTGLFLHIDTEFTDVPVHMSLLEELSMNCFPWDTTHYCPESHARIGWTHDGLHVLMYSREPRIRAEEKRIGGEVYKDSCLEFFIGKADQPIYFNFECNPIGVMHIGMGTSREDRRVLDAYPAGMRVATSLHRGAWWAVEYVLPADFLWNEGKITLKDGVKLRGNVYKCGDASASPHYGVWNPIVWPKPDFHRPEFFGGMILKENKA